MGIYYIFNTNITPTLKHKTILLSHYIHLKSMHSSLLTGTGDNSCFLATVKTITAVDHGTGAGDNS